MLFFYPLRFHYFIPTDYAIMPSKYHIVKLWVAVYLLEGQLEGQCSARPFQVNLQSEHLGFYRRKLEHAPSPICSIFSISFDLLSAKFFSFVFHKSRIRQCPVLPTFPYACSLNSALMRVVTVAYYSSLGSKRTVNVLNGYLFWLFSFLLYKITSKMCRLCLISLPLKLKLFPH